MTSKVSDHSFVLGSNVKVSKGAKIRNRYNQVPHPYTLSLKAITSLTRIHIWY